MLMAFRAVDVIKSDSESVIDSGLYNFRQKDISRKHLRCVCLFGKEITNFIHIDNNVNTEINKLVK
jgi:hypothetical protein